MEEVAPKRQSAPIGSARRSNLLIRLVSSLQDVEDKPAKRSLTDHETSRLFLTQQRVVGREEEILLLENIYNRISEYHSELVLIRGPSGSGKSTLLEAFVRKLPASVFHVSGKFDQLQSHAPYAALVSASDQLCRQALQRENSHEIRERIRELLGPEINLLGSLIPTIAKMTAEQKGKSATSNVTTSGQGFTRFKLLFRAFLRCVASEENPIILFLDDIQWADEASLEVLKALVTDGLSKHIMIIGAYREGEMPSDVLRKYNLSDEAADSSDEGSTISESTHQAVITEIVVTGLDVSALDHLIRSVLEMENDKTLSLSKLVLRKTAGNAFYALNFLDMLLSKNLLSKTDDGLWTWDEEEILQRTNVSDNLAAILERKLRGLPEQVRSILQIASFIGHSFTADVLVAIVYEEQDMIQTEYTFDRHSKEVIHEQIMMTLKVALTEGLLETARETEEYKFSHDRIQQCLYMDLIPDPVERGLLHQRIGTLIWTSIQSGEASDEDDWMFLATENLNSALKLVDCSEIRCELVRVNLKAAKIAMERTAFIVASEYLRIAVRLLKGEDIWKSHYDMCIELYSTAAEAEKSIGCYERSRELVQEIHKRAKSFQEQLEAYCIDVESLAVQGDLEGSISLGLKVLRDLGMKFPKKIASMAVAKEIVLSTIAIGSRSVEDILNIPEMTDQNMLNALKLMNTIMINSFVLGASYKEMYAAVCLRMVRMTLKYGLSALFSPPAFAAWGAVKAVLGQYESSLWAERVSLGILDKYNAESARGRTLLLNYSLSHLWRNPLNQYIQQEFLRAYHLSMSFGDINFAYHSFMAWLCTGLYIDYPIHKINKLGRSMVAEGREYQSSTLLMFVLPTWQVLLNLEGDPQNLEPSHLSGESFDDDFAINPKETQSRISFFAVIMCRLIVGYTFEDWGVVPLLLPLVRKHEKEGEGYFVQGINLAWAGLANYDLYRTTRKRQHKREGRRAYHKIKKWVANGTVMLLGHLRLLAAMESLCVARAPLHEVDSIFDKAFVALSETKCLYFEAFGNERLAKLYLTEEVDQAKGTRYLNNAIALYQRWGALAKVEWLERRYNQPQVSTESAFPY